MFGTARLDGAPFQAIDKVYDRLDYRWARRDTDFIALEHPFVIAEQAQALGYEVRHVMASLQGIAITARPVSVNNVEFWEQMRDAAIAVANADAF